MPSKKTPKVTYRGETGHTQQEGNVCGRSIGNRQSSQMYN